MAKAPRIPWVIQWSEEDAYEIRPCRYAGGRRALWQPFRPRSGKPQFASKHIVRERRAVAERLCTVCGAIVNDAVQWLDLEGVPSTCGEWYTLLQPPFHADCVEETLRHCPFVRAGKKSFAPYSGTVRTILSAMSAGQAKEWYGFDIPEDAKLISKASIQVPISELETLNAIAVTSLDGFMRSAR